MQKQLKILGVSSSAYYGWLKGRSHQKSQVNHNKEKRILEVFNEHKRRYGTRRIVKTLSKEGMKVSRYKVSKLLRENSYKAIQPRSFVPKTTNSKHRYRISPNRLQERSPPVSPDEVWVGDITYIPLAGGGWAYLGVWMDLFSRMIVGWKIKEHMKEDLVTEAFKMAKQTRKPAKGLIVHSDRGGQYGGNSFRRLLFDKYQQSMSRADNPYDNAFMESCFSRFKAELLEGGMFENAEDARTETFEYIEMYYNRIRLHSSLDYKSPTEFELDYYKKFK